MNEPPPETALAMQELGHQRGSRTNALRASPRGPGEATTGTPGRRLVLTETAQGQKCPTWRGAEGPL